MPKGKKAGKVKKAKVQPIGRDGEGQDAIPVAMLPVICPRCNSPRRTPFKQGRQDVRDFQDIQFQKTLAIRFNRIVYRVCVCLDCGQKMQVREFTMQPESRS